MREGGKKPDPTAPLAMLSAILPAPMKPRVKESEGIGTISIVGYMDGREISVDF